MWRWGPRRCPQTGRIIRLLFFSALPFYSVIFIFIFSCSLQSMCPRKHNKKEGIYVGTLCGGSHRTRHGHKRRVSGKKETNKTKEGPGYNCLFFFSSSSMTQSLDSVPHDTKGESIGTLHVVNFPCARLLTLFRPAMLNALSLEMAQHMLWLHLKRPHPRLPRSAIYILKGAGNKSFCAGGDVRSIVAHGTLCSFLRTTYQLNYHILTMPNPQVSLWDGYVMGGGVGVSVHGRYRVASECAVFAMPETAIGLFPDVGASWFLPRLEMKGLGLYLGLTGARLKGADVAHTGLATHYVPSTRFCELEERLCHLDDPAKVEACLEEFAVKDLPPFTLEPHRETIEKSFALEEKTTVEGIYESLSADGGEFAMEALKLLRKASPTSLKVTLELFRRASQMTSIREAMSLEYGVIQRMSSTNEFAIGVNALLIEKTGDPQWERRTLEEVTAAEVDYFFDSVGLVPWDPEAPLETMMEAKGEGV